MSKEQKKIYTLADYLREHQYSGEKFGKPYVIDHWPIVQLFQWTSQNRCYAVQVSDILKVFIDESDSTKICGYCIRLDLLVYLDCWSQIKDSIGKMSIPRIYMEGKD